MTAGNAPSSFTDSSANGWTHASRTIGVKNSPGTAFELRTIYVGSTTRINLTNAANRTRFTDVTAGNTDILTCGNGITGSIPKAFLASKNTKSNEGASNWFFLTSGVTTLVNCAEVHVMSRSA